MNPDSGFSSFYLYKDKGEKLTCGPLWDFDIAGGNNNYAMSSFEHECPADYKLFNKTANIWFNLLLKHDNFFALVKNKLEGYETTIKTIVELVNPANENGYYLIYSKSLERNFERWSILDKEVWANTEVIVSIQDVKGQMFYLRNWLLTRYWFMRSMF